jgi:hypothetical protein
MGLTGCGVGHRLEYTGHARQIFGLALTRSAPA